MAIGSSASSRERKEPPPTRTHIKRGVPYPISVAENPYLYIKQAMLTLNTLRAGVMV